MDRPARLRLLGGLSLLRSDGAPVRLRTRRAEDLLAFLLLHPGAHPRERLAGLLWPDAEPSAARTALRQELSGLRRALAEIGVDVDAVLRADRAAVALDPPAGLAVDALQVEAAVAADDPRRATVAYAGDLLPDRDEEWVVHRRDRLRTMARDAWLDLARIERGAARYPEAIACARAALELDPLDERAHQQVMVCAEIMGDRATALAQYERLAKALADGAGAAPGPQTEALRARILRGHGAAPDPSSRPTNLPHARTSFVGRDRELSALETLLAGDEDPVRLVTLTGPGGSGKTRLAMQAGADLVDDYPGGVWWVELADLTDPDLLDVVVATAVGVRDGGDGRLLDAAAQRICRAPALLVVDNCEHLIDDVARLVDRLLQRCPTLVVLATSREPLRVSGEVVLPVPPLARPPVGPLRDLERVDSARLFLDRATAVRPDLVLDDSAREAVADICRRLDGLPLAIELAAARAGSMPLTELADRLDDRFRLLTGGSRTALPRQQTLRALVDWSHDLLDEPSRVLLRRLAVFAGGWTASVAEQVVADPRTVPPAAVADLLGGLVDRSLVLLGDDGRYGFLDTIHAYATDRLRAADEADQVSAAHAAWALRLATEAGHDLLDGREQLVQIAALDAERDNLRVALTWTLEHDPATAVRLVGRLWPYWDDVSAVTEGRDWCDRVQARLDATGVVVDPGDLAALASGQGTFCWRGGEYAEAARHHQHALDLARAAGDEAAAARALTNLAAQWSDLGDTDRYLETVAAARVAAERSGDRFASFTLLNNHGVWLYGHGDYAGARDQYSHAAEVAREGQAETWVALSEANLAEVLHLTGRPHEAVEAYDRARAGFRATGTRSAAGRCSLGLSRALLAVGDTPGALEALGEALDEIEPDQPVDLLVLWDWTAVLTAPAAPGRDCARLLGAAEATADRLGLAPVPERDPALVARTVDLLSQRIGPAAVAAARESGGTLTWAQATALSRSCHAAAVDLHH